MSRDGNGADYFGFPPRPALNGTGWLNCNWVFSGFEFNPRRVGADSGIVTYSDYILKIFYYYYFILYFNINNNNYYYY